MNNNRLTRVGFDYARLARLAMCVVVALNAIVARAKNLYSDWARQNAVNLNAPTVQDIASQNTSAPMLQRIKQESQSCSQVIVQLKQRPLNADIIGAARAATGGTAAHVQVVAIDKRTGKVVDNFGVTGDFGGGGKARIFSEKDLGKYDSEPCGMYEMSIEDYYAAKARTIKQIEGGAIYEPYSGVGLKDMAKAGAEAGAQAVAPLGPIASAVGAVAGAVGGAMAANDIYETRRHDYGIHPDSNAKMSSPIVNCQAGGDMFVKNLEGMPTVVTVKKYIQPGEKSAKPEEFQDEAKCVIDTSKLEALLKRMIVFAQSLLDAGEKATEDQISTYNSYADEAMRELVRLLRPILALPASDADKQKIFKEKIEAKLKVLIERHQVLQKQLVSRGLVGGLRPVSLDGLDNAEFGRSAKGEDSCSCGDPVPYVNAKMGSIPQTVMCEKCGRVVGVETNGRIISNNPAANGKAAKLSSGKGK